MVVEFLKSCWRQIAAFLLFRIVYRFVWYPTLHHYSKYLNLKFLNFGYIPKPDSKEDAKFNKIISKNYDGITKIFTPLEDHLPNLYLYEKTLSMCPKHPDLEDFEILEAGCGLGNGMQWVQSAHPEVKSTSGIDRVVRDSQNGMITYSDVHDMQKDSNSYDLVLNVESSHFYANIKKFLQEVERVLKPGGFFCWTDIAYSKEDYNNKYIFSTLNKFLIIDDILKAAEEANLELINYEDITKPVLKGIDQTAKRYDQMCDKLPWFIRMWKTHVRYFYCAPDTEAYELLENGKMIYAAACWKKRDSKLA